MEFLQFSTSALVKTESLEKSHFWMLYDKDRALFNCK